MVTLSQIKNWFRTGLKPTQAQFWDTWDSFWHKQESIPQSAIDGLEVTLQNLVTQDQLPNIGNGGSSGPVNLSLSGSATYNLPGGKLLIRVVLVPSASGSLLIGTTAGGSQLFDINFSNTDPQNVVLEHLSTTPQTIHFTGDGALKLYIDTVSSVEEITVSGSAIYALQAQKVLERILIFPSQSGVFSIGENAAGTQLFNSNLTQGHWSNFKPEYFKTSAQDIHFTGNALVKIFTI